MRSHVGLVGQKSSADVAKRQDRLLEAEIGETSVRTARF